MLYVMIIFLCCRLLQMQLLNDTHEKRTHMTT